MGEKTLSLKAADPIRVRNDIAEKLRFQRNAGNPLYCPAQGKGYKKDMYNRPANINTLPNTSAECSHYTFTTSDLIQIENVGRPTNSNVPGGLYGNSRERAVPRPEPERQYMRLYDESRNAVDSRRRAWAP